MAIKLVPNPTFKAKVTIPAPGEPLIIEFEFKHKTVKQLDAFIKAEQESPRSYSAAAADLVVGWTDAETPFSADALQELFDIYHAAARAVFDAYMVELRQAKLGN